MLYFDKSVRVRRSFAHLKITSLGPISTPRGKYAVSKKLGLSQNNIEREQVSTRQVFREKGKILSVPSFRYAMLGLRHLPRIRIPEGMRARDVDRGALHKNAYSAD
ncbi:MAG: hypothetical protein AAGB06_03810 [Verrucomicrobiota bacterium]